MGVRETLPQPTALQNGVLPFGRSTTSSPEATAAAVNRAPQATEASSQTADLLEALRRRRGERESASWGDSDAESIAMTPSGSTARFVSAVDVPLDAFDDLDVFDDVDDSTSSSHRLESRHAGSRSTALSTDAPGQSTFPMQARGGRKGRAAMPSWDEIVFGARSDDDLA